MSWTDERVAILTKLWSDGLSCSQIAARLGDVTRNAVIGKITRLGLPGRKALFRTTAQAPRKRRSRERNNLNIWGKPRPYNQLRPEPYVPLPQPVIPPHERKPLVALTETCCRWPIGDPKDDPDFGFCPAKAVPGLPYCEAHASIAYQTPTPRVLMLLAAHRQKQRELATAGG